MASRSIELNLKALDGSFVPCTMNAGTDEIHNPVSPVLNAPKFLYVYLSETAYQVLNSHWQHKQKITWLLAHDREVNRLNPEAQQEWIAQHHQDIPARYEASKKQFIDAQLSAWISTGIFSFQKSSLDILLENDQSELERQSRSNDTEETKHRLRITWLLENDSVLKDLSIEEKRTWTGVNQDHKTKGREVKELYEASLKANATAAHRAELESHYALTDIFFWPGVPTSSGMQLHIAGQTWPLTKDMAYGMIWSENFSNASTQQMQAVAEQIDFLTLHFENAQFRDDSPRRTNIPQLSAGALAAGRGLQVELDASDRRLVLRALARVQSASNNRSTDIETEARILEEAQPKWKRRLIIGSILVVSALVILAAVLATPAWLGLLGVGGAGGILAAFGIAVSHIIPPAVITGIAIAADSILGISLISLTVYAISKCIGFCRSHFSRKEPGYRAVDEFEDKSREHNHDIQLEVLADPYDRDNVFDDNYTPRITAKSTRQARDLEMGDALQASAKPKPIYIPSLAPKPAQPKQLANVSSAPRLATSANARTGASEADRKQKKEKKRLQISEGSGRQLSSGAATVSGTAAFSAAPVPHPQTFVPPAPSVTALGTAPASIHSHPTRTSSSPTTVQALQPTPSNTARAVSSPVSIPAPQLIGSSSAHTESSPAPVATSLPTASSPARVVDRQAPASTPIKENGQGPAKKETPAASTASPTSSAPTPPPALHQKRAAPQAPKLPLTPTKSKATAAPVVSSPAATNSPQSSDPRSNLMADLQGDPIAAMRARKAAKEKAAAEKKAAAGSTASTIASPAKPTAPVGKGTLFPTPGNKKGAGKAAASPGNVADQAAAAVRAMQAKKAAAGTPKM
jgi:hypothetical protein